MRLHDAPRRPGAGAARLPRVRGDAGARARRRAAAGHARGLRGAAARAGRRASRAALPARRRWSGAQRRAGAADRAVAGGRARPRAAGARHRRAGHRQDPARRGAPLVVRPPRRSTAEARSYRAEGALAYGPVVGLAALGRAAPRRVRLDRGRLAELARLLPELSGRAPEPLPEAEQRRRLFDAIARALLARRRAAAARRRRPALGRPRDAAVPALPAAQPRRTRRCSSRRRRAARSSTAHPLTSSSPACGRSSASTRSSWRRLTARGDRRARRAAAARRSTRPTPTALYAETEGNPLFVVEALRAGWTRPRPRSPKVQAVIEARLAQLSPAGARAGRASPRRSGASSRPTCSPARARSTRPALVPRAGRAVAAADRRASTAPTPTTSATTSSARSPTSRSSPAAPAAHTTCASPGRSRRCGRRPGPRRGRAALRPRRGGREAVGVVRAGGRRRRSGCTRTPRRSALLERALRARRAIPSAARDHRRAHRRRWSVVEGYGLAAAGRAAERARGRSSAPSRPSLLRSLALVVPRPRRLRGRPALRRAAAPARGARRRRRAAVEGDYVLGVVGVLAGRAGTRRGATSRPPSRATGPSTGRPTWSATGWTRRSSA